MRAAQFAEFGGPDVLRIVEIASPSPAVGEVLVRVRAAALQPYDVKARTGRIPLPPGSARPLITGNEFAGVVETASPDVTGFKPGDAVVGRHSFGAAAEYLAVAATDIAIKPAALSFAEAATYGGTAQTADAAIEALSLGPDSTLLIHGAAGGVGGFAVQLARLAGAAVVGVAGAGHADYLRELGAIPLASGEGQRERLASVAPQGVTAVLDCVGGEALDFSLTLGRRPREHRLDRRCPLEAARRPLASRRAQRRPAGAIARSCREWETPHAGAPHLPARRHRGSASRHRNWSWPRQNRHPDRLKTTRRRRPAAAAG